MLPPDVDIDTMDPRFDTSKNFLQFAGPAQRLTLERVRPRNDEVWHDADLDSARDILGKGKPDVSEGPVEHISMSGDREQVVYSEEVFTADEVVDIFAHYYRHGFPPPAFTSAP